MQSEIGSSQRREVIDPSQGGAEKQHQTQVSLYFLGSCPSAGAPHLLDAGPELPILRALAKMAQRGLGEIFVGRESIDGLGRGV